MEYPELRSRIFAGISAGADIVHFPVFWVSAGEVLGLSGERLGEVRMRYGMKSVCGPVLCVIVRHEMGCFDSGSGCSVYGLPSAGGLRRVGFVQDFVALWRNSCDCL